METKNTEEEVENKKTVIKGPTCDDCDHWHNQPDCVYNTIHEFIKKCARGNVVSKDTQICDFVKLSARSTEKDIDASESMEIEPNGRKKVDFKNKTPKIKK